MAGPGRRLRPLAGRRSGQGNRRSPAGARLPARARQRARAPARVPVSSAAEAEEQLAPGGRGRAADPAAVAWVAGAAGVLADPGIEVDPAWVVTAEDAALALGEPVVPARPLIQQPSPVGRMRGCRYQAASGLGSVSVFTAAGDLVGLLVRVNRRFGDPDQGVGDEAFLRGDTIVVIKGEIAASIRVQGDQVPDRVAALRRLASTAAGRLASTAAPRPDDFRAGLRGSPAPPGTSPGPS
jgi:hypothetical protein